MKVKRIAFILIVSFLTAVCLLAGETLEEVLAKNYRSRGGLKRLKSIKTMYVEGKVVLPQQNMEMPMKLWHKKPNKMRMESIFQGQKIIQAYDGETVWWIMPFMGTQEPQRVPDSQAEQIKEQADFTNPLVEFKEKGYKLELIGKEEMEGTEVYKLKLTKKDGKVIYYYLDVETGIELKTETYVKRDSSEFRVENVFGDYKEVNGIMVPFYIENRVNGQLASQIILTKVKFNVAMDDKLFSMPSKGEESEK